MKDVIKFEVGKSYYMFGGRAFHVCARSKEYVYGFVSVNYGIKTVNGSNFRKKIFLFEGREILSFGNILLCCSDYFSRG